LPQSEYMNASIQGSVLQVIEKAGHVSNLEQPDEFNKHLLFFLTPLIGSNFEKINGELRMS
jgi:3-oxoadipate enol-lactonase